MPTRPQSPPTPHLLSIMNHSTYHNQKPNPNKPNKHTTKRLTEDQVRLLESYFDSSKKLEPDRKHQLSRQLGIPPRQIAIWYQNKRARWKNQSLEHDYTMLQLQLEASVLETKHLQKEVDYLRTELNKVQSEQARHNRYYNNDYQPLMDSSFSRCGDDVGSSSKSLEDDTEHLCGFGKQVFDAAEMYTAARMMGMDILHF
ncbi:homeobox-leucine zipper protein ATHB-52 [Lactuca sativa]|uniref:homeobox-leucine zipper protein ATHB-52 n=1 Tax=Lactuca sativa TaxID=4236 RepID=UPI001C688515|nr:homeobox-leucine zipper protein ATHB-52 [Lactuca sativa]